MLADRGLERLQLDRSASGKWQKPEVHGRGDGAMLGGKYTSLAIFARTSLVRATSIELLGTCAHDFGSTEGSKGAVAVVVRIGSRRLAVVNCHLSAVGASGGMGGAEKRGRQFRELDASLGKRLAGCAYPAALANAVKTISPPAFDGVIWMGDMNYRLQGIDPKEAVSMVAAGQLLDLMTYDELGVALRGKQTFEGFREPLMELSPTPPAEGREAGSGHGGGVTANGAAAVFDRLFFPTYKKKKGRTPTFDYSDADWVDNEYRTRYKEKMYKGGRTRHRCPSWCDRILYTDAEQTATGTDEDADADRLHIREEGGLGSYGAINHQLLTSDHSPIYARLVLAQRRPDEHHVARQLATRMPYPPGKKTGLKSFMVGGEPEAEETKPGVSPRKRVSGAGAAAVHAIRLDL